MNIMQSLFGNLTTKFDAENGSPSIAETNSTDRKEAAPAAASIRREVPSVSSSDMEEMREKEKVSTAYKLREARNLLRAMVRPQPVPLPDVPTSFSLHTPDIPTPGLNLSAGLSEKPPTPKLGGIGRLATRVVTTIGRAVGSVLRRR
jgi:hypothetical protein